MIVKHRHRRRFLVGISAGLPALCGSALSASRRETSPVPGHPVRYNPPGAQSLSTGSFRLSSFLGGQAEGGLCHSHPRVMTYTYDLSSTAPKPCNLYWKRTTFIVDAVIAGPGGCGVTTYIYDAHGFPYSLGGPQPPGMDQPRN
jgi:hypothetical protein